MGWEKEVPYMRLHNCQFPDNWDKAARKPARRTGSKWRCDICNTLWEVRSVDGWDGHCRWDLVGTHHYDPEDLANNGENGAENQPPNISLRRSNRFLGIFPYPRKA